MQITIVTKGVPESIPGAGGRPYKKLEVVYRTDRGDVQTKKLVSFKNPAVFKLMSEAKEGQVYEVDSVKDETGKYWEWKSAKLIQPTGELPTVDKQAVASKAATPVREVVAEADRQRWIVRQSSIAQAVNFSKEKVGVTLEDVLEVAKQFENWVFRAKEQGTVAAATPAPERMPVSVESEQPVPVIPRRGRPRKVLPVTLPASTFVEGDETEDEVE